MPGRSTFLCSHSSCNLSTLLTLIYQYTKGVGLEFLDWVEDNYPDHYLVPLLRATSGTRQDFVFEAAAAIYMNRWLYVKFLFIKKRDNDHKLANYLWSILGSKQMTAALRTCAIFFFGFVRPHRYLVGKSSDLTEDKEDWSAADLKRVADTFYNALDEIRQDPSKALCPIFMLGIFDKYRHELPTTFAKYLEYMYDFKSMKSVKGERKYTVVRYDHTRKCLRLAISNQYLCFLKHQERAIQPRTRGEPRD